MEEFKGTPGPWHIKPVEGATVEGDLNVIQTNPAHEKGYHIAYATSWNDDAESAVEADANTRLIAAAPELLEALLEMVGCIDYYAGLKESEQPNIEDWAYASNSAEIEKARCAINKALGK